MLPIEVFVTIDAMLNFNGDHDGHSNSDVTCKQTLTQLLDEIRKTNMWWKCKLYKQILTITLKYFKYALFSDVNECGTSVDNCAATDSNSFCVNEDGGFGCQCRSGFHSDVDKKGRCIGTIGLKALHNKLMNFKP